MKPLVSIAAFIIMAFSLCAQTDKLPKIRASAGFLTTHWELGEKDVKQPDIRLHLEKHNTEAYYQFRRAEGLDVQGTIWMIVGLGASIVTLTQSLKDDPNRTVGISAAGIGVVSYTAAIICYSIGGVKQRKAIDIYNRAAGY